MTDFAHIEIECCTQCRWPLGTAWLAHELLITFEDELQGVTLRPGKDGVFDVRLNGDVLWSRKDENRFPELKEVKQRPRDRIAPRRDLGHSDRA